jgi:hypothetical protein
MSIQWVVYFAGIFALGLIYQPLKSVTGGGLWFFLAAVAYLGVLRLIGYVIARLIGGRGTDKQS